MTAVLIIEDSPEDRELIADLLRQTDPEIHVSLCADGAEGLRKAETRIYDCVLLDMWLDGEDGLEVLDKLCREHPSVPIIVLTGHGNERVAVDAFVGGAAYYLPKDRLAANTLWVALERVIQMAETKRELAAKRDALERSNRLDAVGQLAAGIAHDFNNQLGTLRICIDLLSPLAVTEKSKQHIETALTTITQCTAMATRLVGLSDQSNLLARHVSLDEALSEVRTMAMAALPDSIALVLDVQDRQLAIHCDQNQLHNALINLIINARDAIKAGAGTGIIRLAAQARGDTDVTISVTDDGVGMTTEILDQCGAPFFSTKKDRSGSGLGLPMVRNFAELCGGEVNLTSIPGDGTTVSLILPLSRQAPQTAMADTLIRPENRGDHTILLVEDEVSLAYMLNEILSSAGYQVLVANSAEAAHDLAAAATGFDLLLTDIRLPGQDGFDLATDLRRIKPALPVIYLTGYADASKSVEHVMLGPILQKPVDPKALLTSIAAQLMLADPVLTQVFSNAN